MVQEILAMRALLCRKHPIPLRAAITRAWTTAGWSLLGLLLQAGVLPAQQAPVGPAGPKPTPSLPVQTITYEKKAQVNGSPAPSQVQVGRPVPVVKQASLQQPAPVVGPREPAAPADLFRVESEVRFQDQIRRELAAQKEPGRLVLPEPPVISSQLYDPYFRSQLWPRQSTLVPPSYVCYRRLLFEQRNAERYGWALGPMHPVVSAGLFFADVATLPYHLAKYPCRKCECSAGLCLPGDPVPLLLYPPELTLSGFAVEAATVAALIVIFP